VALGLKPAIVEALPEVWMLIATPQYMYEAKNETILSRLMLAAHLMIEDQIRDQVARMRGMLGDRLHVIRPSCGSAAGTLHFDHDLIDQARIETTQWLNAQAKGHA
jgi:anti-sigma factor ChrR (cupin superfamily)